MSWVGILLSGIIGGILGTAVSALFTWRSTWSSYNEAANKSAIDVDHLFIRYPELRPFFYDGKPLTNENLPDYSRAMAAREFVADSLEAICDNREVYNREDWESWLDYVEGMLKTSPTLYELMNAKGEDWYPSMSSALAREPRPRFARTRRFWKDLRS